jgi:signal transduction histidine kinase
MVELRKRQNILEAENLRTKKIEAIGILAGGMAHDFNNLLQVILGYVSLARMNAEPGSKTESLLTIAEQSSESARELGTRLLTFAKGGEAFMKPTRPEQLIRKWVEAELDSTCSIKPVINLPDDLPLVMLDASQIRQVVANLITNACEAMPHGGTLSVSASADALTAANNFDLLPGDYLHILFEDTGIGIPPENVPKISARRRWDAKKVWGLVWHSAILLSSTITGIYMPSPSRVKEPGFTYTCRKRNRPDPHPSTHVLVHSSRQI